MGSLIGGHKTAYSINLTHVFPHKCRAFYACVYKKGGFMPPFGRPPNWVSHTSTVHRTVEVPVLISVGKRISSSAELDQRLCLWKPRPFEKGRRKLYSPIFAATYKKRLSLQKGQAFFCLSYSSAFGAFSFSACSMFSFATASISLMRFSWLTFVAPGS